MTEQNIKISNQAFHISKFHNSIFHYTDEKGLYGILKNKSLRATHNCFVNDSNELQVFKKVILNVVEHFLKKVDLKKKQLEVMLAYVDDLINDGLENLSEFAPIFLVCFCPAKNNYESDNGRLSQWRGYSKDSGYCIEFKSKNIEALLKKEFSSHPTYNPCLSLASVAYYDEYDKELKRDNDQPTLKELRKDILNLSAKLLEAIQLFQEGKKLPNALTNRTMHLLASCSSRIKNYGFHEESEIRIVAPASNKMHLKYIAKKNALPLNKPKLVDFREFDNAPFITLFQEKKFDSSFKNSIKSIIIGPGIHQKRRELKVRMLLEALDYKNVKIKCSTIPYVS